MNRREEKERKKILGELSKMFEDGLEWDRSVLEQVTLPDGLTLEKTAPGILSLRLKS